MRHGFDELLRHGGAHHPLRLNSGLDDGRVAFSDQNQPIGDGRGRGGRRREQPAAIDRRSVGGERRCELRQLLVQGRVYPVKDSLQGFPALDPRLRPASSHRLELAVAQ